MKMLSYNILTKFNIILFTTDYFGCPFGTDPQWWITWANTPFGETDEQPCPGYGDTIGMNISPLCLSIRWLF